MSIIYNAKIPANGNPEGIVDAPRGTWFVKKGKWYKINYSGSAAAGWEDAYFKAYNIPNYYLTNSDMNLLAVDTGSYLYVKESPSGTPYGWKFLDDKVPFIYS